MSISAAARAIVEGHHHDPFNYLGWHREGGKPVVRVFLPEASAVKVFDAAGHVSELPRIHDAGLFAGPVAARDQRITGCARASATVRSSWKTPIGFRRS